jgi:hypothetical protein
MQKSRKKFKKGTGNGTSHGQALFKNKLDTLNKFQKEVEFGRMLGPFNHKPISTLRISPIGPVEKSDHS